MPFIRIDRSICTLLDRLQTKIRIDGWRQGLERAVSTYSLVSHGVFRMMTVNRRSLLWSLIAGVDDLYNWRRGGLLLCLDSRLLLVALEEVYSICGGVGKLEKSSGADWMTERGKLRSRAYYT